MPGVRFLLICPETPKYRRSDCHYRVRAGLVEGRDDPAQLAPAGYFSEHALKIQ